MAAAESPCPLPYPERFHAAVKLVERHAASLEAGGPGAGLTLSDETRLLLYALKQQALEGPNATPRPWGWNVVESTKWLAWSQLGSMSRAEAMFRYVQQLEHDEATWWSKACQRDVPAPLDNPTPAPPSPSSAPPPFPPLTWVEVTHGSHPRPLGRHDHACAVLGDSMYLFGGISRGRLLNDLWRLDLPSMEWEMLHPGTHWGGDSAGPCPAPAAGHGMVAWGATLLTIGGHHPSSCIDSHVRVFAFDTRDGRWAEVETAGEAPTRRGGHSVTMVGSRVVVYGGERPSREPLSDAYILDLKAMAWTRADAGEGPGARAGHTAVRVSASQVAVYGGGSLSHCFNDAWLLDVDALRWRPMEECLAAEGDDPGPRASHAAAALGGRWYLVGGVNGEAGAACSDLLVLSRASDVVSPAPAASSGHHPRPRRAGSHLDAGAAGAAVELAWRRVPVEEGGYELAAEGLTVVAWEAGGALVAFGGYDGRRERSAVAVMRVEESGAEATKGRGEGAQAAAAVVPGLSVPSPPPLSASPIRVSTARGTLPRRLPQTGPMQAQAGAGEDMKGAASDGRTLREGEGEGDYEGDTEEGISGGARGTGGVGGSARASGGAGAAAGAVGAVAGAAQEWSWRGVPRSPALERELAMTRRQLVEAQAEAFQLEGEVGRLREEKAGLAREAEGARQRAADAEREAERGRQRCAEMEGELQTLRRQVSELRARLTEQADEAEARQWVESARGEASAAPAPPSTWALWGFLGGTPTVS